MTRHSTTMLAIAVALALAGCNTTQPRAVAPPAEPAPASAYRDAPAGVTPSGFTLPAGGGCEGDIARWAAIQENDLKTGHVAKSVYDRIQGEIAEARAACAAGQGARASALVRASRARHGYPG